MTDSPIVKCADLKRRFGEGEAAVDAIDGISLEFPKSQADHIQGWPCDT